MAGTSADIRKAQLMQHLAHMALMVGDAEPFFNDPLEINAPPTNHAVSLRISAGFNDLRKLRSLRLVQLALGASPWRLIRPSGPSALKR